MTLRNPPETVTKAIKKRAVEKGLSINKAVISLLEDIAEKDDTKRNVYHDLDHLAGRWSKDEAEKIEKAVKEQRSIDKDLWK